MKPKDFHFDASTLTRLPLRNGVVCKIQGLDMEHSNTGGDGLHEKSFSATPDSDGDIGLPKKLE